MAQFRKGFKYFSNSDLYQIKKRTNDNYHLENYIFIAKKTGYKTVIFKELKRVNDSRGYSVYPQRQYEEYQELMRYLGNLLSPQEYQAVYERL